VGRRPSISQAALGFCRYALRSAPYLASAALILLLVRSDLNQAESVDPAIYTALIHDYADIAARYPGTYYAIRLAHILPGALTAWAFGDYGGYHVLRLVQLAVALGAIYVISSHYANRLAALLVTGFFGTHVWLLRSLLWELYDGTVVVYSLVGLACLLARPRNSAAFHFAAGLAFALAANCNPMGMAIASAYAPAWLFDHADRPRRDKIVDLVSALVGLGVGYVLTLVAILWVSPKGAPWLDHAAWDMMRVMVSGGAQLWFVPFADIFRAQRYQVLIFPFLIAMSCVAMILGARSDEVSRQRARAAAAFTIAISAIFALLHFVILSAVLNMFQYLCYVLPAGVVVLSCLVRGWRPSGWPMAIVSAVALALCQVVFWHLAFIFVGSGTGLAEATIVLSAVALVGLLLLAANMRWLHRPTRLAPTMVAVLVASNGVFLDPQLTRIFGDGSQRQVEWDVRAGTLYLQRFVAEHVPPEQGAIRFWYGPRDWHLNAVQSAHLWGFSRLSEPSEAAAQMPVIDDGVRKRLDAASYVAILGTDEEIARAFDAIVAAGFKTRIASRGAFKGQAWDGYTLLLLAVGQRSAG
jgi:hypothetical protein